MNYKNSNQVQGYTDDASQRLRKHPNQVSSSFKEIIEEKK